MLPLKTRSMSLHTISKDYPLILASASPRRKALLKQMGLPFRPFSSYVDENLGADQLSPTDPILSQGPQSGQGKDWKAIHMQAACHLAEKKARTIRQKLDNRWILGADTMVVLGNTILGKPADHDDALSMLLLLGGKEHSVMTGFCLLDPFGRLAHAEEITTSVQMKPLTEDEVRAYIATGEPFGKAGSYAIQGIGSFMVESIRGSYTNVVGLPLCALIKALLATGALNSFPLSS